MFVVDSAAADAANSILGVSASEDAYEAKDDAIDPSLSLFTEEP